MISQNKILPYLEGYIRPLQEKYPNFYIGGSVSLMLQNYISFRDTKDIDIIASIKIPLKEIQFPFSVCGHSKKHIYVYPDKFGIDMFYNPDAKFIEINGLRLSPIEEILYAKQNKIWIKNVCKNLQE